MIWGHPMGSMAPNGDLWGRPMALCPPLCPIDSMNILDPEDEEEHTQEEDSSGSNEDEDDSQDEEEEEEEDEDDQVGGGGIQTHNAPLPPLSAPNSPLFASSDPHPTNAPFSAPKPISKPDPNDPNDP